MGVKFGEDVIDADLFIDQCGFGELHLELGGIEAGAIENSEDIADKVSSS